MCKKKQHNLNIFLKNNQSLVEIEKQRLSGIIKNVFFSYGIKCGEVSIAVVSDREIAEVNKRFLGRNEPTDVIAFTYEYAENAGMIEGEIIINAQQACRESEELGHSAFAELMLYAVHGALHLLGWEDDSAEERNALNRNAAGILEHNGIILDCYTLWVEE